MRRATQSLLLSFLFVGWLPSAQAQSSAAEAVPNSETPAFEASTPAQEQESDVDRDLAQERDPDSARTRSRKQKQNASTNRNEKAVRAIEQQPPSAATKVNDSYEGLAVGAIEIRGNKKIEADAISARLVTKVGSKFSVETIRQDIEALFKSGYFYDVRVNREMSGSAVNLIYTVVEKPTVIEVGFSGNSEVGTDDLQSAAALKSFELLNMNKVREATEKIQKVYEDKGYFLARVVPKVEPVVEGESVKITFHIEENEKVKVKRITILGNRHLPDGKLKSVMQTQEGGFFSFMSEGGSYKQDAFDRDIQLINYLYFNEGYVQVQIDRPHVFVTPDKKGIYITIRVDEGERFKVGSIDFAGDLLFERDELFNTIEIDSSEWYSHETVLKDLRAVQAKYGDLGYAYANIIPRTRIREKDREFDITLEIDKGNKVYFGRINVIGNSRTRDKVLRRELSIHEGELYNETRKRESLDNVKRLGFFEDVTFNSKTSPDNPDLMDIDVLVKERNTGSIQLGAGYSSYSKFILNGQVNQANLFGRGQKLGVSIDWSSNQSYFNLNFTEPYFLDSNWLLGVDAYRSDRKQTEYKETKTGGALRVGHPLGPFLRGTIRYKLDQTEIALDDQFGDRDLFPTDTANGLTSSATFTLEYDKRDDRYTPTNGLYSSASLEYAGLGGDKRYTKGFFTGRFYKKFFWEFVLRNNLTYGFIRSNDPDKEPPYNELFLLGGANSLRGFDWYRIGKRRVSQRLVDCYRATVPLENCPAGSALGLSDEDARSKANVPFGGRQQLFYQAEIEFPMIKEAGIKGVVFYDVGMADDQLMFDELRHDVGFGFRWFSPIGPLRFEWGFPLARREEERAMNFQFAIGSPF